jgi:hypothetical protein
MKRFIVGFLVTYMLAHSETVFAYGVETHRDISRTAVQESVLKTDPAILSNLGLKPFNDRTQTFPNYQNTPRIIFDLIPEGSVFEDNVPRALNHFYNPRTNGAIAPPPLGHPSPDWALEDHGEFFVPVWQRNSFHDARDCFLSALTADTEEHRSQGWGCTFQSLGQIIHHLQDMT